MRFLVWWLGVLWHLWVLQTLSWVLGHSSWAWWVSLTFWVLVGGAMAVAGVVKRSLPFPGAFAPGRRSPFATRTKENSSVQR